MSKLHLTHTSVLTAFYKYTLCGTVIIKILTSAPSRLKMADAPTRCAGAIFLLHRRRRNVSDERSFLWNFQPISEEYSQPSGSPRSLFCQSERGYSKTSKQSKIEQYMQPMFYVTDHKKPTENLRRAMDDCINFYMRTLWDVTPIWVCLDKKGESSH